MPTFMQISAQSANYEMIGRLVKSWATGTNLVDSGPATKYPMPTDGGLAAITALQKQLTDAQTNLDVSLFTKLKVVSEDAQTLVLRIPPAALLAINDGVIAQPTESYPLPRFYLAAVADPGSSFQGTLAQRQRFDFERIGDYTISLCC